MMRSCSLTSRGKRTLSSWSTIVVCVAGGATKPSLLLSVIHGQTRCGRGTASGCMHGAVCERRLRCLVICDGDNIWTAGFALRTKSKVSES